MTQSLLGISASQGVTCRAYGGIRSPCGGQWLGLPMENLRVLLRISRQAVIDCKETSHGDISAYHEPAEPRHNPSRVLIIGDHATEYNLPCPHVAFWVHTHSFEILRGVIASSLATPT